MVYNLLNCVVFNSFYCLTQLVMIYKNYFYVRFFHKVMLRNNSYNLVFFVHYREVFTVCLLKQLLYFWDSVVYVYGFYFCVAHDAYRHWVCNEHRGWRSWIRAYNYTHAVFFCKVTELFVYYVSWSCNKQLYLVLNTHFVNVCTVRSNYNNVFAGMCIKAAHKGLRGWGTDVNRSFKFFVCIICKNNRLCVKGFLNKIYCRRKAVLFFRV